MKLKKTEKTAYFAAAKSPFLKKKFDFFPKKDFMSSVLPKKCLGIILVAEHAIGNLCWYALYLVYRYIFSIK